MLALPARNCPWNSPSVHCFIWNAVVCRVLYWMVWNGLMRFCMVCSFLYGMVHTVLYCMVRFCIVWYGFVWYVLFCMVGCSFMYFLYGMVWYGVEWSKKAPHGRVSKCITARTIEPPLSLFPPVSYSPHLPSLNFILLHTYHQCLTFTSYLPGVSQTSIDAKRVKNQPITQKLVPKPRELQHFEIRDNIA